MKMIIIISEGEVAGRVRYMQIKMHNMGWGIHPHNHKLLVENYIYFLNNNHLWSHKKVIIT